MVFFLRSLLRPTSQLSKSLLNNGQGLVFGPCPNRSLSKKPGKTPFMSWKTVGISGALGGILLASMLCMKAEKQRMIDKERKRELGKAKIGGSFELVDMNGVRRTSEEFKGKWCLIYFGFTNCPDICPDELEKMAKIIDLLENHKEIDLQALFVSVDPDRDTPEAIKAYLAEFHPKILGLTGTMEQLTKTTKTFRVYFSAGPKDQEDDYIVDHTIIMYLIDPDGKFIDYYGQNRTARMIVDGIQLQKLKFDSAKKGGVFGIF